MFAIDLLKGQGRPARTKPQGVAIFVATFAVPMIVAMLMAGYYYRNKVLISIYQQDLAGYVTQTERLEDSLKLREALEKDKSAINGCLAEVAGSIGRHTQWSPILVAIVQNLPESVVLNSLEIKQSSIKRKAVVKASMSTDSKDSKDKKADTSVAVRTLKLRVSGTPSYDCDRDVKAFRESLRASNVLGPKLEDVVIASQGRDTLDGREVVSYDIDCIFKPGL
jgi:Tfp pilus assembly protein PilN